MKLFFFFQVWYVSSSASREKHKWSKGGGRKEGAAMNLKTWWGPWLHEKFPGRFFPLFQGYHSYLADLEPSKSPRHCSNECTCAHEDVSPHHKLALLSLGGVKRDCAGCLENKLVESTAYSISKVFQSRTWSNLIRGQDANLGKEDMEEDATR